MFGYFCGTWGNFPGVSFFGIVVYMFGYFWVYVFGGIFFVCLGIFGCILGAILADFSGCLFGVFLGIVLCTCCGILWICSVVSFWGILGYTFGCFSRCVCVFRGCLFVVLRFVYFLLFAVVFVGICLGTFGYLLWYFLFLGSAAGRAWV